MLTKWQIVEMSRRYTPISGVYFLIEGNEIVYVGQSIDVYNRVTSHALKGEKVFDRYAYIEVNPDDLNEVEADYIVVMGPKLNGPNLPCYKKWVSPKFISRLLKDTPYTMNHVNRYIAENNIKDCNGFYRRSDFAQFLAKDK